MAKTVKLYDGGEIVGFYENVETVYLPYGERRVLVFKVRQDIEIKGEKSVVLKEYTTTLHAVIEEVTEHSGALTI